MRLIKNLGLIAIIGILFLAPSLAEASVYKVHLRYDSDLNRLAWGNTNGMPIELDTQENINPLEFSEEGFQGPFYISFLFDTGEEIAHKNFDPSLEKSESFTLEVPYFSFSRFVRIYKSDTTDPVLSYDLASFMTCNKNGICEYEKGENLNTCLPDCVGVFVNFSDETRKLLAQNNDVLKDPKTGEILLRGPEAVTATDSLASTQAEGGNIAVLVVLVAFFVVIGIFVVVILKIRKRNRRYGL